MTDQAFVESEMTFGPFSPGHCFRIETSQTYLVLQNGLKVCEFLLLQESAGKQKILLVEAKSSSPRPGNTIDLDIYLSDLEEKFANAVSLTIAMVLGRHAATNAEVPAPFRDFDQGSAHLVFALIVKGHQADWLPPLQDALRKRLHRVTRVWDPAKCEVVVINDVIARQKSLIQ